MIVEILYQNHSIILSQPDQNEVVVESLDGSFCLTIMLGYPDQVMTAITVAKEVIDDRMASIMTTTGMTMQ